MTVRIKVCGITCIEDAMGCVDRGVDGLGFIFCKSKRQITQKKARPIIQAIPSSVFKVGVFQNQPLSEVAETARYLELDFIQLHGDEDREYIEGLKALKHHSQQIIKVIPVDESPQAIIKDHDLQAWKDWPVAFFLLDTKHKGQCGGLGRTFPWVFGARFEKAVQRPYFLAGGLDPHNVADALKSLTPWAIDVNSGVEKAPGIKDLHKVEQIVRIVKERNSHATS